MTRALHTSIAVLVAAAAVLTAVVVASASTAGSAATKSPTLKLRKTSFGTVLVNSHGRSLYAFAHDLKNKSRCKGSCAQFWPPAKSPAHPTLGAGVSKAKLKVIHRADGSRQLSYNGHPLYTFVADSKPGDVNGENLVEFGGKWDLVNKAGKIVTHKPSSSSSTTTSGGGSTNPYPYPY